jgi:hypothetical protein
MVPKCEQLLLMIITFFNCWNVLYFANPFEASESGKKWVEYMDSPKNQVLWRSSGEGMPHPNWSRQ